MLKTRKYLKQQKYVWNHKVKSLHQKLPNLPLCQHTHLQSRDQWSQAAGVIVLENLAIQVQKPTRQLKYGCNSHVI